MKISNILQVSNIYKNNTKLKNKKSLESTKMDNLNLSSEALDYQKILTAVNKAPNIREDKINDIMERINNGTYKISSEKIAEKILSNQ